MILIEASASSGATVQRGVNITGRCLQHCGSKAVRLVSEPATITSMKSSPLSPFLSLRGLFGAVLLGVSLAGLSGCLAVAAGAGASAVAYARGDLETSLNADYGKVVASARSAVTELEFAKVSENKDALKAVLVARTALDKKVEITIANSGKKLTNIKIRVGVFGDESLSMAILDKIKSGL